MVPGDLPPEDVLGGEEGMGQEYDGGGGGVTSRRAAWGGASRKEVNNRRIKDNILRYLFFCLGLEHCHPLLGKG